MRADLEKQMQANIFKRERDRLYMNEKEIATNKGLLQSLGARLSYQRPAIEVIDGSTDINLLQADEEHCANQV